MHSRTNPSEQVVRLRREGNAVLFSVPARLRETLSLKPGDVLVVRAARGNLVARKVDLRGALRGLPGNGNGDK